METTTTTAPIVRTGGADTSTFPPSMAALGVWGLRDCGSTPEGLALKHHVKAADVSVCIIAMIVTKTLVVTESGTNGSLARTR